MSAPKFSILIASYCNASGVRACIEAIQRFSTDYELRLWDNGGQAYFISEYFDSLAVAHKNVTVYHSPTNLGFMEPMNRMFADVTSEFTVLVNDDVIVTKDWLKILAEPFAQFPRGAISGPQGGCTELDANFNGRVGRFEYIEGALMMIRTEIVKCHGPLFSRYLQHSYGEDSDLSLRMRQLNYGLHQVKLQFSHARAVTSRKVPNLKTYQDMNHAALRRRWSHYLRVRKFDFPILIRRADAFGDVLLTTPIIRALKEQNPCSPIWVETNCTDVMIGNPHVARCARQINPDKDTLVIDLNMVSENAVNTHVIDAYARQAGLTVYDKNLEISTAEYPANVDGAIAFHCSRTCWFSKNWSPLKWVEVIESFGDQKIVLVGNEDSSIRHWGPLDLRGKTSVQQLAGVLKRCRLLVCHDSFPLHVATAVGCPTVGLFGVTSPGFLLADGAAHFPVCGSGPTSGIRHKKPGLKVVDDNAACINTITTKMVLANIQSAISLSWLFAK